MRMMDAKVVEEVESEIQAACVPLLAGSGDGLEHGGDGIFITAKVCLEDGQVQQGVVIVFAITVLHGVVEVPVKIVKGCWIVPGPPSFQEPGILLVCFFRRTHERTYLR